MKKLVFLALTGMMLMSVVGCSSGVSQEEYDKVVAERDSLLEQIEAMTEQLDYQAFDQDEQSVDEEPTYKEQYIAGQYKVGEDIPAGEYVILADGDSGYFSVSSDANNEVIIFNDNFDYNSIITILDGEYLKLSRSTAIPFDSFYSESTIDLSKTGIMLYVGKDIDAGEYKLSCEGENSGYYCIYSSSRQDDIITNDNFDNYAYVSVSEGQYLALDRCYVMK